MMNRDPHFPTDEAPTGRCPRCGKRLGDFAVGGGAALVCSDCRGLFIPSRWIAAQFGDSFAEIVRDAKERTAGRGERLTCPIDCGTMKTRQAGVAAHRVEFDTCGWCGGNWFDEGEVEGIRRQIRVTTPPQQEVPTRSPEELLERARQRVAMADADRIFKDSVPSGGLFSWLTGLPGEVAGRLFRVPVVTWSLIILCALVFFGQGENSAAIFLSYGLIPRLLLEEGDGMDRLISSMFLHGDLFHLAGNMYFLRTFGDDVEDRLGRLFFFLFYLACGIGAGLIYAASAPTSEIPAIGASGAISGLLGAYLIFCPDAKIKTVPTLLTRFQRAEIPAFFFLPLWLLLQFLYAMSGSSGVAWWAHIGGFFVGFGLALIAKRTLPDARIAAYAETLAQRDRK